MFANLPHATLWISFSVKVVKQYDKYENNPALSEMTFPFVERSLFVHSCRRACLLNYKKAAWYYCDRAESIPSSSNFVDAGVLLELPSLDRPYLSKTLQNV